jgi:HEPN domain-containing protein
MNQNELVEYWIKAAELDLPVMESLYANEKYVWSLYLGHLVLEKILKAYYSSRHNQTPPKTHNLVKLCEMSGLTQDTQTLNLLDEINEFNIEARYPDAKFDLYKRCDKDFTLSYLQKIKELYQWIKSQIML